MSDFQQDIDLIHGIAAVRPILQVVSRVTRLRFAAVARVTADRWIACEVFDEVNFGLVSGGELPVDSTICKEIHGSHETVVIDHVAESEIYCDHHTPRQYGFQSYISTPIILSDGGMFGTLCAIDPLPARVSAPEIVAMFRLFAELIAHHIEDSRRLAASQAELAASESRLETSQTHLFAEQESSVLREQFIAVLGHDLRTPLSSIVMASALLSEMEHPDPRARQLIEMMRGSASRMTGLIEDVMDFARGRLGGGLQFDGMADAALEPVLRQVIGESSAVWPGRRIETDFQLEAPVHCDARRIAQLFMNLLGNAIHHGHSGEPVRVRAISRAHPGPQQGGGDGACCFELSVANAADEIPADTRERMFLPFARGGDSEGHKEGLGLGLYIASEIARAHGGTLEVTSRPGEVCFTFRMQA